MKLKLSAILFASQAIEMVNFRTEIVDGKPVQLPRELPTKLSYWLSRLEGKIVAPKKAFEKARLALFEKFGEKTGAPGSEIWEVKKENLEAFGVEINALTDQEDTIEIEALPISLFEGERFPKDFFILMGPFIKD